MGGAIIFGIMMLGAFVPLGLVALWVRRGRNGPALTFGALAGAGLVILAWGADGRLGLDPMLAVSWAMLFFLPATIGSVAGWLLGWLMRRRDERS